MKKKTEYILGSIFAVLSVIFTVLVMKVDVGAAAEVPDTQIGLSHLNNAFHKLTGVNFVWYKITNAMGIISIIIGLLFAAYGLITLIKRRSLLKVDRFLYALAGVYVLLGLIYVGFEKIVINYRPIIMEMEGATEPEASFPSSHTVLIVTIIITAAVTFYRLLQGKKAFQTAVVCVAAVYTAVGIFGRLYCGVHWLTDVIASLLISSALIFFYCGASKENDGKHIQKA